MPDTVSPIYSGTHPVAHPVAARPGGDFRSHGVGTAFPVSCGAQEPDSMDWQGWFTLGVVALCLAAMIREVAGPDLIMMAGLFALAAVGILTPAETFAGFSNQALAAVGALFVVSGALRETGAIEALLGRLLGRARAERDALTRISAPVAAISAFLNNAPIVAMLTPGVIDWARRHQLSASRCDSSSSFPPVCRSAWWASRTWCSSLRAGCPIAASPPRSSANTAASTPPRWSSNRSARWSEAASRMRGCDSCRDCFWWRSIARGA
jgi:hypothetical protein